MCDRFSLSRTACCVVLGFMIACSLDTEGRGVSNYHEPTDQPDASVGGSGGATSGTGGTAGTGASGLGGMGGTEPNGGSAGNAGNAGSAGQAAAAGHAGSAGASCVGPCMPGEQKIDYCGHCNQGTQTSVCNANCSWDPPGDCVDNGCEPGSEDSSGCSNNKIKTCTQECEWGECCSPLGQSCESNLDCCSNACVHVCCIGLGDPCETATDCCSQACGENKRCCRSVGRECADETQCCSGYCSGSPKKMLHHDRGQMFETRGMLLRRM